MKNVLNNVAKWIEATSSSVRMSQYTLTLISIEAKYAEIDEKDVLPHRHQISAHDKNAVQKEQSYFLFYFIRPSKTMDELEQQVFGQIHTSENHICYVQHISNTTRQNNAVFFKVFPFSRKTTENIDEFVFSLSKIETEPEMLKCVYFVTHQGPILKSSESIFIASLYLPYSYCSFIWSIRIATGISRY